MGATMSNKALQVERKKPVRRESETQQQVLSRIVSEVVKEQENNAVYDMAKAIRLRDGNAGNSNAGGSK